MTFTKKSTNIERVRRLLPRVFRSPKTSVIQVKSIASDSQRTPTHFLYGSTWLNKAFTTFARHGLQQRSRNKFIKVFAQLRLRYQQAAVPLLFRAISFFRFPLAPRQIIRRRGSYEKIGVIRPPRQRKIAINAFSTLATKTRTVVDNAQTVGARLVQAILNAAIFRNTALFKFFEMIWGVVWERPSLRRRQRFSF